MGPAASRLASRNVARPRLLASGRTVGGNADGIGHCVLVRNVGHQGTPLRRALGLPYARDLVFGGLREPSVLAAGLTSTGTARMARRSIPATNGRLTEDMPGTRAYSARAQSGTRVTSTSLDGWLLPRATSRGAYSPKAGPARFGTKKRRSPSAVHRAGRTRLDGSHPVLLVVDRARHLDRGFSC